jgi:hypothetical protein
MNKNRQLKRLDHEKAVNMHLYHGLIFGTSHCPGKKAARKRIKSPGEACKVERERFIAFALQKSP